MIPHLSTSHGPEVSRTLSTGDKCWGAGRRTEAPTRTDPVNVHLPPGGLSPRVCSPQALALGHTWQGAGEMPPPGGQLSFLAGDTASVFTRLFHCCFPLHQLTLASDTSVTKEQFCHPLQAPRSILLQLGGGPLMVW